MPSLQQQMDRLAEFKATDLPVISLYLDTRKKGDNHEYWDLFIHKQLVERADSFEPHTPAGESYRRDVERIRAYLDQELQPETKTAAIFACAGADDFFEALQLAVPIDQSGVYVLDRPQLYDLALIRDEHPRYAAVLLNSNRARIIVFSLGRRVEERDIQNEKITRSEAGGWSQARYQRHADELAKHHVKEVVDVLDQVVRRDKIAHIILAGDVEIIPVIKDQLPDFLAGRVADTVRLEISAEEHEVLDATMDAIREQDAVEDEDRVQQLLDQYRSGGLGVVGVEETLAALTRGQVDELVISASLQKDQQDPRPVSSVRLPDTPTAGTPAQQLADVPAQLIAEALNTGASVNFIEDSARLDPYGGVGAILRFRLQADQEAE